MAWYAYCIGEKQAFPELARHRKPIPLESVVGVCGNQVFLYPASDLAIVVSEHNPTEGLRKSIRSNQRQFQGNLERLHGKTEMHLKIYVDSCCKEQMETLTKHLP